MSLTASQILSRVNRKIHNAKAKLGGDTELFDIINEASRDMQLEVDLVSLKRYAPPFIIYPNVYEYPLPADVAYAKTIFIKKSKDLTGDFEKTDPMSFFDLRNPVNGVYGSAWSYRSNAGARDFSLLNTTDQKSVYAVEFEDSNKYLLLRAINSGMEAQIQDATDPTSNGTWAVFDDATNIRKDAQRNGIFFDSVGVGANVTVANSTFTPVDLSQYVNLGRIFFTLTLPTFLPTSVTIKWGSSPADYYQRVVTTRQNGLGFRIGENLIGANWLGAAVVGAPDATAINYLQVIISFTAPVNQRNYGINGFFMRTGEETDMNYYSKYSVRDVNGVLKETFTATDDSTVLQEEEINLLLLKSSIKAAAQLRELAGEYQIFTSEYNQGLSIYMMKHPSHKQLEVSSYWIV